eukprot:1003775-Amphidinium_carterae.1
MAQSGFFGVLGLSRQAFVLAAKVGNGNQLVVMLISILDVMVLFGAAIPLVIELADFWTPTVPHMSRVILALELHILVDGMLSVLSGAVWVLSQDNMNMLDAWRSLNQMCQPST